MRKLDRKIDWYRVLDMLSGPLCFAATYITSEVGFIIAIAHGWSDRRGILGAFWVLGLFCGGAIWHVLIVRTNRKLHKKQVADLEDLLERSMALNKAWCLMEIGRASCRERV